MTDVYEAPKAELQTAAPAQEFYLVSVKKFCILFLVTLGLYALYWFYRHWRSYRQFHQARLWPVARAVFAIFFVHSLFAKVQQATHPRHRARHLPLLATLYVLFTVTETIAQQLVERALGLPYTIVLSYAAMVAICVVLAQAQRAVNTALGDPGGQANARFTFANIAWCLFGALFWLLAIAGSLEALGLLDQTAA